MKKFAIAAAVMGLGLGASAASANVIFSNTHSYGGIVTIDVTVEDNYLGDFGKYWWKYDVTNISFDPNPGTSNGFSGFETALPAGVPDLMDRAAPSAGWEFDCCSGQPVEYDIRNSAGLGIMPGDSGQFSFTSLPRFITNSTGYFHTWQGDGQTDVTTFASFEKLAPKFRMCNGLRCPNLRLSRSSALAWPDSVSRAASVIDRPELMRTPPALAGFFYGVV